MRINRFLRSLTNRRGTHPIHDGRFFLFVNLYGAVCAAFLDP